jgi:hypothetical protein
MAKMDHPSEPYNHQPQPVGDFAAFSQEKIDRSPDSIEIEALHDVELAFYKLAMWAHPAALTHIIERDMAEARKNEAPSTTRIRELISNISLYQNFEPNDPLAKNFAASLQIAGDDARKISAITTVRSVHTITLRSEKISPHVQNIVYAILASPDSE